MSYLDYQVAQTPTGWRKILYLNWPLVFLVAAVSCIGFLMLYSVSGGNLDQWAGPQMERFAVGMTLMIALAFVPIWFWRSISVVSYVICVLLLILVETIGQVGMGAQRWLLIGPVRIQPSELTKVAFVMTLAAYYDWLPVEKVSRPLWVLIPVVLILLPTALVLMQPDLGTSIMLIAGGGIVMFAAGVSLWYFAAVIAIVVAGITTVMESRGTDWQLLHDYQFKRIDTFLDPTSDPLGAGYNIAQAQIALGSGGWSGRGFMQGTQSRLNFLPEKHTDFIFTTLAEEFGFVGAFSLLLLYAGIIAFCIISALQNRDRFSQLLILGVAANLFFYIAVNLSMVMGMAPVVGVPLPLLSYGGSAMLVLLVGFGLVQSAHIHRPR